MDPLLLLMGANIFHKKRVEAALNQLKLYNNFGALIINLFNASFCLILEKLQHGGYNLIRGAMSIGKCFNVEYHLFTHLNAAFIRGRPHMG